MDNYDYNGFASYTGLTVLLGNGDGTFQPPVEYASGSSPLSLVAGDFTGNGRLDLAFSEADYSTYIVSTGHFAEIPADVKVLLGNGDGTFGAPIVQPIGNGTFPLLTLGDFNGDGRSDLVVSDPSLGDIPVLLSNGDGTFSNRDLFVTTPHATPLVADVNGDGTPDVLVVDGAGDILYRQGIPGQPGSLLPPVTVNPGFPSRDIAWIPTSLDGPLLASVDAHDDAVSLYSWRNGSFTRIGSLTTGKLPAQIIAADLNGSGWDDLVVRNAGDGTLTVFFNNGLGSFLTGFDEPFLPPVTIPVGLGVSDVQAIDTNNDGHLDLVVTNKLTGQVDVLYNDGDNRFAALVPYRAGTGLSAADAGSSPEVTSLDGTASVAAGPLTPGGPASLVTVNPGSYTIGVLAGLGGSRFADPAAIDTLAPGQIVRMADLTGNGVADLVVLTTEGVSVYLGDGKGGFLPPTTYAVPSEADGLTLADLNHDGQLDILVGDPYGDVLVLIGQGNGSFAPYREANQSVELAVADLTGHGSKDIIYADQGLDRVTVDYGAGQSAVLADQSTGLLQPGAVALADLNGDGIPDLIVANSGSNNVLIFPGLGNGQFGPGINDGKGYFVGTNPVGITVADLTGSGLPDLVIADKGSNQVSILLNTSQKGGPISFAAGPRLNSGGSGPVATVVGHFTAGPNPDLLVTNSLSNDVVLLPGVGQGFFNDQNPTVYSVGSDPGPTFVGNFNGQPDLVTVNAGSNDLTLISDFTGASPVTSTIASGGVNPDTAFAFSSGSGFEDLVVGNEGDGALALFDGGADGLTLTSVESEPGLPAPTDLAFSALTGGAVDFYAATAGRESAELVALSLSVESATVSAVSESVVASAVPTVQLVSVQNNALPLVATVLTLTIDVSSEEEIFGAAESEALATIAAQTGAGISVGQPLLSSGRGGGGSGDAPVEADEVGSGVVPVALLPWERFVLGLDEALEEVRRQDPFGVSGSGGAGGGGDREGSEPSSSLPARVRRRGRGWPRISVRSTTSAMGQRCRAWPSQPGRSTRRSNRDGARAPRFLDRCRRDSSPSCGGGVREGGLSPIAKLPCSGLCIRNSPELPLRKGGRMSMPGPARLSDAVTIRGFSHRPWPLGRWPRRAGISRTGRGQDPPG